MIKFVTFEALVNGSVFLNVDVVRWHNAGKDFDARLGKIICHRLAFESDLYHVSFRYDVKFIDRYIRVLFLNFNLYI